MDALRHAFVDAGRYPTNARPSMGDLREAIARRASVRPENIALGSGSWEILRTAVRLYTSSSRPLVTAAPSYESPERMAEQLGVGVRKVAVDADGRLDLEKMAQAARWAGLVFLCNPNNPTSTVHSARAVTEFVARVRRESPETAILIDEAYHDYVTDPGYATSVPLALEQPNVVVSRTLSKAYGLAGMRVGYAVGQPRTIEGFNRWAITFNQNSLAVAAAIAALGDPAHIDAERARNVEARGFATGFFRDRGFKVMDSQTNFLFVELGRPAREFKEACAKLGLLVGRPFPPLEKTHARVSVGTLDEMRRAGEVMARVLGAERPATAGGPNGRQKK
jgi:histidinol-phosphate aminotransferase